MATHCAPTETSSMSSSPDHELPDFLNVPVLIVGAGPTGLLLAYLLAQLDVQTLVVEKYPERLAAPKAHAISPRSLEICRQFGLDTTGLRRLGTARDDAFFVNFVTNLNGERIGRLPYERMDPAVLEDTPEMIHNIPQPVFEQFIASELANHPNTTLRKGYEYVSCSQDASGVTSILTHRTSKHEVHIRSQYVVGCDGARSAVRSSVGVQSWSEEFSEALMTIHFKANVMPLVKDRVGMLHWILDPAASGFIIGYDLTENMVLISNFDPEKHPVDTWTLEHSVEVLRAALGSDIPIEVLSYRPWILSRKVAEQYRQGRVFLAGDAAHSFPPTGGLGLNCGIADVHNLAYKLASVYHGQAPSALLNTYETERQPVAHMYAKQSEKNGREIFSFLKTLGTTATKNVQEARSNLQRSIADPSRQSEIAAGVERQREHFDNLEMHIGYVYNSNTIPPHASRYTPKFSSGARLPHAFISFASSCRQPKLPALNYSYVVEFSAAEREARRYSTLDLCAMDAYTLIIAANHSLAPASTTLSRSLAARGIKLNIYILGQDFTFSVPSHEQLFLENVAFQNGGALLIRPDQHILQRFHTDITADELRTYIVR